MGDALKATEVPSSLVSGDREGDDSINTALEDPVPFTNPYSYVSETIANDKHMKVEDDSNFQTPIKEEIIQATGSVTPGDTLDGAVDGVDTETAMAIAAAQNEYGTRVRGTKKQENDILLTVDEDISQVAIQAGPVTKKRPAPKSTTASSIKKPLSKKRKIDPPDDRSTPASSKQSPTPSSVSTAPSKTPGASKFGKASKSATPKAFSPLVAASPGAASEDSDDQVYCICRRPDDHTFMIGCDGDCDDWFHGKCVQIRKEDEALIDKFVCPGCRDKGIGVTTWKPMCRRAGCRNPARLKKGEESKYCSQDCGVAFMKSTVKRAAGALDDKSPGKRGRNHKEELNIEHLDPNDGGDSDVGPLGGLIRTHELNALAQSTASIDGFRSLGSVATITPPFSTSLDTTLNVKSEDDEMSIPNYTEPENSRLVEIVELKAELRLRRQILKDRGNFIALMKTQRDNTAERMKIKDICGFDSRWSLDDIDFKAWRDSDEGWSAFDKGSLESSSEDTKMTEDSNLEISFVDDSTSHICKRKRCERHRQWQKLVLQDVRFEEAEVGNEMRNIDGEEKEIMQQAFERAREKERDNMGIQRSYEGWVEIVAVDAMDLREG